MATIKSLAQDAARILRQDYPRARERTLGSGEIEAAIRAHLKAVRKFGPDTIETSLWGGFVANSYKYRADSDRVWIKGTKVANLDVQVDRTYAQCRAGGRGDRLIVRALRPGQVQGRVVTDQL